MTNPNVLLIMADQQRFDYLGYMGADFVNTPNLDRLAARGTVFTHCCTNAPICAPARIGLASGMDPWRLGSLGNNSFLPRSTTTYYQRLRDYGYRVGCVGKLDLAKPDQYNGRHGDRPCVYTWGFTHPEEWEFYDLKTDSQEMKSVYGDPKHQIKIAEMKRELQRLRTVYKVPPEKKIDLNERKSK
jgi:arylsulfatase A-like enzyme